MRRRLASTLAAAGTLLILEAGPARAAAVLGDPAAGLPAGRALAPLVRGERVERHTPETLWERIDGEAELYNTYRYAASAHALYEDPATPDRRIDLSVFRFSDPLGAFGLFAAFRPPDCAVQQLGNGGCLGDYQGFFWSGDFFVLADAAGPAATRPGDLRRALEAADALLGPPPTRPEPLRAFSRFVETRTIRYQPRHLLGREALPPGLEGKAGATAVFLSVGPGGAPSAAALDAYAGVLEAPVLGEHKGLRVLTGRDPALGPVILLGGRQGIGGARAAADTPGIRDLLETIGAHGGDPDREGAW
jgi:hypothetical protein